MTKFLLKPRLPDQLLVNFEKKLKESSFKSLEVPSEGSEIRFVIFMVKFRLMTNNDIFNNEIDRLTYITQSITVE